MRITKFTHACVRVDDGGSLVIDPGTWSEAGALLGVDAVLVTHEHVDHIDHVGYILDDAIYHPGDSLHLPDRPVETVCVPAQATWLHFRDTVTFAKKVNAARAFAIHDGQLNAYGMSSVNGWLAEQVPGYRPLAPRETI